MTLTDLNELEVAETESPESPLALLRGIKFGTETYHDLCRRLCRYSSRTVVSRCSPEQALRFSLLLFLKEDATLVNVILTQF